MFRRPLLGAHELLSHSRLAAVSRRAPRYAPFLALVKIWTTIVHGGKSYTTGADMADWVDQGQLVHVRDFAERDPFQRVRHFEVSMSPRKLKSGALNSYDRTDARNK